MSDTSCTNCDGLGYTTGRGKRWAAAQECDCQSPCPRCKGEGRIITQDAEGRAWVTPCGCVGLRHRIRRYNEARLPAAYHNKLIEDFDPRRGTQLDQDRAKDALFAFLGFQEKGTAGDRGILLMGPPGVGKTHLMCGIIRFLTLERGQECRYVDSFQLLEELKATFDAGSGASKLMDKAASVPFLALDELGKQRTQGWQREVMDQIISRRYDQGLTSFCTSNYFPPHEVEAGRAQNMDQPKAWAKNVRQESLQDRVGSRIYSRLCEMCVPYLLTGEDGRQNDSQLQTAGWLS